MRAPVCRLTVTTGGGSRITENLTRDLYARLVASGIAVEHGATVVSPTAGHKGAISPDLVILASIAATSATKILTTLISQWCAADRNREIRITLGSDSLDVKGGGQHIRRVLDHFFTDSAEAGEIADEIAERDIPAPPHSGDSDDCGEPPR